MKKGLDKECANYLEKLAGDARFGKYSSIILITQETESGEVETTSYHGDGEGGIFALIGGVEVASSILKKHIISLEETEED